MVKQFIPNVLMTPLDNFLLTHIFEIAQHKDGVEFFAEEWPGEVIFLFDDEPDQLLEAIEKTKDIDPELCADVKRAMQTDGDTVDKVCCLQTPASPTFEHNASIPRRQPHLLFHPPLLLKGRHSQLNKSLLNPPNSRNDSSYHRKSRRMN